MNEFLKIKASCLKKAKHLETLSNRSSDFKPHIEVFKEFHCCQRTEGKGKITRSCKGKKLAFVIN